MVLRVVAAAAVLVPLATAATAQVEAIGAVEVVQVWAYGTPPGQGRRDLFYTTPVYGGELVETVRTGALRIEFVDGTTLALGSESAMSLDELVFDPDGPDSMAIDLTAGLFHFVTGEIEKEAVVITTPAMIIGVRGTDLIIAVAEDGATTVEVRDGVATAAPRAGGDAIEVSAGSSASASPDSTAVSLSDELSSHARGDLPTAGSGFGESGGASRGTPAGPVGGGGDDGGDGGDRGN